MKTSSYSNRIYLPIIFRIFSVAVMSLSLFTAASAQRDYFTEAEIELIRDEQQLDKRMYVLIHAIDRRFGVLKIDVAGPSKKPSGDWGELPAGTRVELLSDIKYIIRKAIDDIDNLAARPDSMVIDPNERRPKSFSSILGKAVRTLAAAAERYRPIFKSELDKTNNEVEKGLMLDSIEMCDEIIAAVAKLPAETKKSN